MSQNTRLLEVLMKEALRIEIDEEMLRSVEHFMKKKFSDSLCIYIIHLI